MDFIHFILQNNVILFIVLGLSLFIIIKILSDFSDKDSVEYQQELIDYEVELENDILEKEAEIQKLEERLREIQDNINVEISVSHGELTAIQSKALDMFESQLIRIPVDIIEDLIYSRLNTLDECIDFINAQRYQWKLENGKKLYRRSK